MMTEWETRTRGRIKFYDTDENCYIVFKEDLLWIRICTEKAYFHYDDENNLVADNLSKETTDWLKENL